MVEGALQGKHCHVDVVHVAELLPLADELAAVLPILHVPLSKHAGCGRVFDERGRSIKRG